MISRFVQFTIGDAPVYIDPAAVVAILPIDGKSGIFVKGNGAPFVVKETPEQVIHDLLRAVPAVEFIRASVKAALVFAGRPYPVLVHPSGCVRVGIHNTFVNPIAIEVVPLGFCPTFDVPGIGTIGDWMSVFQRAVHRSEITRDVIVHFATSPGPRADLQQTAAGGFRIKRGDASVEIGFDEDAEEVDVATAIQRLAPGEDAPSDGGPLPFRRA